MVDPLPAPAVRRISAAFAADLSLVPTSIVFDAIGLGVAPSAIGGRFLLAVRSGTYTVPAATVDATGRFVAAGTALPTWYVAGGFASDADANAAASAIAAGRNRA